MSYWGVHYMLAQQEKQQRKELYTYLPFIDEQHVSIEPLINIQTLIEHIHPEWLAPFLDQLERNDLSCIASTLSVSQQQLLKLQYPFSDIKPSPFIKRFVYFVLYQKIKDLLNLPTSISYLPKHPLNALLTLSFQKLSLLCFYLSLFDLKAELESIIDVSVLKSIESSLTPKEIKFISSLKENYLKKANIPKLNLSTWKGEINNLKETLLNRGTYYLAYALGSCSPILNWRILHTLNRSKGEKMLYWQEKQNEFTEDPSLTDNILKTIVYINTGVEE